MKILVVASKFPPEYSGPGVRIPRLYKAIGPELDADVQVLCGGTEYTKWEDYEHEGFPVRRRAVPFFRHLTFLPPKIREFLTQCAESLAGLLALRAYKDIDMVHILGCSGLTAAAIFWANRKGVSVFQELVTAKARPFQRLGFWSVKPHARSVIMALREDAARAAEDMGYARVWKRSNPIDTDSFCVPELREKIELRRRLTPFGEEDVVLTTVAKLMPQKNQIFLLDVLVRLSEKYKLVIAGPKVTQGPFLARDTAYFDALAGRIEELDLASRVHIVADYVNAADYMRFSDIYAMPAWDEGFGTPMIEALACGVPVIANEEEPVFGEWIRNGDNGFVCCLVPELWEESIRKAVAFPPEQRREEAEKMALIAGDKTIYDRYVSLIKELVLR